MVLIHVIDDLHRLTHAALVGVIERGVKGLWAQLTQRDRLTEYPLHLGNDGATDAWAGPDFNRRIKMARADNAVTFGEMIG